MSELKVYGIKSRTKISPIQDIDESIVNTKILPEFVITGNENVFDKDYLTNNEEIVYIDLSNEDDFRNSKIEAYINILESSANSSVITEDDFVKLTGIFVGVKDEDGNFYIRIQQVYPKYRIKKPVFCIFSSEYKFYENGKFIFFDSKTDIYYDGANKRLYFKNFALASKFLNLDKYYREATDDDIETFLSTEQFVVTDRAMIINKRNKKKIAQLLDEDLLDNIVVDELKNYSHEYGVELRFEEDNTNNTKIIINNNDDIVNIYNLLKENYYSSYLHHEQYLSNSKKKL